MLVITMLFLRKKTMSQLKKTEGETSLNVLKCVSKDRKYKHFGQVLVANRFAGRL